MNFSFKIKIDNIGRLKNATISTRPLTILAGPNNTGKSFFSKTLYSIFDAMNSNFVLDQIRYNLIPLMRGLRALEFVTDKDNKTITDINNVRSAIRRFVKSSEALVFQKENLIFSLQETHNKIVADIKQITQSYKKLMPAFEQSKPRIRKFVHDLDELKKSTQNLEFQRRI